MLLKTSEKMVTEVTSEVWRRNEQVHDFRTELSLRAPHSEEISQHQNQEYAGLLETQQY